MFFTVLDYANKFWQHTIQFFQISFTVRAKASLALFVLKIIAYCTVNNILSQSVTVSLLVSCCVGVEEGRFGKSQCHSRTDCIIPTNLHFVQSFSNFLDMLANFSPRFLPLNLNPCPWELACGIGNIVACGCYSLYMHSKQLVHYRCCGQILTRIK